MKNTDIFTSSGYDMVVAVTQQSINDQLNLLQNPDIGVIPTTLIMQLQWSEDGLTEIAKTFKSWDDVEKLNGLPLNQTINAEYSSSVQITESGTVVNLVLTFTSGLFYWMNMGNGHIMPGMDMTGWKWGISVNVDLAGMERDEIANHQAISPSVKNTLENFTTDQFSVSNLYLDLQGTDLAQFNPGLTSTFNTKTHQDAPKPIHDSFIMFVSNYLEDIKQDPTKNPYILGYTVVQTTQTPNPDVNVPASLDPIGSTFTVFHDPTNPQLSTINFVLNTKASVGSNGYGNHPTPGNFDTNWISSNEQVEGQMTYGSMNFLETIILRPFYQNYATKVFSELAATLTLGPDQTYDQAKQAGAVGRPTNATGFVFQIHNVSGTHDDYTNTLTANWGPAKSGLGITINLGGNIHAYKFNSVSWGLESAEASVTMDYTWTSEIDISLMVDKSGTPQLTMNNPTLTITSSNYSPWQNDFAKFVDVLGEMLGGFADMFTAFQDHNNATNWFLGWMAPDIHGVGGLDLTLGSVSDPAQKSVMLPAGDVFFFKDVGILPEGCLSLGLTYKSATGNNVSAMARNPSQQLKAAVPILTAQGSTKAQSLPPPPPRATAEAQPANLGNPVVDQFSVEKIMSPAPPTPATIDVTVSCELMSNSKLGMPVSPSANMIVVQDNKGSPLIFTIGSDERLYLLIGNSGQNDSGWSSVNLLDGFTGYTTAVAFDAIQDVTGALSLAFAFLNNKTGEIDVFLASQLSNDLTVTDFGELPTAATKIQGIPATFTAESIRLGSSDDGKQPLLTIEGSSQSKHVLYQLEAGAEVAQMLELPEDITPGAENLLGQCQGFSFGQRSNFFLYKIGDTKRLIARTNADATHGSISFDYSSPALPAGFQTLDYNTIQVATSRSGAVNTASDLYVGTSTGVYRIPNGKAAAVEQVVALKDVHAITVTTDGDHLSVWVTSSPNFLYYVYGQRGTGTAITWNSPVLFASNVVSVAPMRNLSKSSNELFVLDSDQTITHYWQDPTSTFWRSQVSSVPKSKYVVNFNSFTTHVHFQSNSLAVGGQTVLVTSSEWQYCTINGLLYSLDVDVPAQVTTDMLGNITIISSAVDISPAILHLQSPSFAETINIYPAGKIVTKLSNVTDGASLQNARAQDGTKILPDTTTPENANGIAANITNIQSAAYQNYPPSSTGKTFTAVEHPASPSSSGLKQTLTQKMNVSHIPNGFVAGIKSQSGVWVPHTPETATMHLATLSLGSAVGDFFGDVWHDIEQVVDGGAIINAIKDTGVFLSDGLSFILQKADDILQFVLTIADKVIRIELNTLLAAFKALNFLFKLIGIDLTVILKWLGHLLGWDKIWDTHKLIAATLTNFVKFGTENLSEGIGELKSLIDGTFAQIESEIDSFILPDSAKTESITNSTEVQSANDPMRQSPQANFASYHLNNAASSGSGSATANPSPLISKALNDSGDPLAQFFDDILIPFVQTVMARLGTDAGDLLKLVQSGSLDDLRILAVDLIKTILDPLRALLDGILNFIQDLVTDVESLLSGDLEIPIIGAIYEFVTTLFGDEEDFSIINGLSFLAAIPIVIMMEIAGIGLPADHNSMHFDAPDWLNTLKGKVGGAFSGAAPSNPNLAVESHSAMKLRSLAASGGSVPSDLETYSAIAGIFGSSGALMINPFELYQADATTADVVAASKFFFSLWSAAFSIPLPVGPTGWTYACRWISWAIMNGTNVICNLPQFKAFWLTRGGGNPTEAARQKSVFKLGTRAVFVIALVFIIDFFEKKDDLTKSMDIVGNFGGLITSFGGLFPDERTKLVIQGSGVVVAETGALMAFVNSVNKLGGTQGFISIGHGGQ